MTDLKVGDLAPDFTLPDQSGESVSLADYQGKYLVIYFYPKDDTPACTTQGCLFRDKRAELLRENCGIIGISKDSVKSHAKFAKAHNLNFPILADVDTKVCKAFGVFKEKSMFGRKFLGIVRSTFLLDQNAKIVAIWPEANPLFNARQVLNYFNEIKNAAK